MEHERDKLAQQSRDREIEQEYKSVQEARIAAEKEKEIQLAKFSVEEARIVSEKEIELACLRSKERQADKDRK